MVVERIARVTSIVRTSRRASSMRAAFASRPCSGLRASSAAIPWGTDQVYRETVRRARREGISLGSLPDWYDIDLPESVATLWKEILHREKTGSGEIPGATDRLLRRWMKEGKIL